MGRSNLSRKRAKLKSYAPIAYKRSDRSFENHLAPRRTNGITIRCLLPHIALRAPHSKGLFHQFFNFPFTKQNNNVSFLYSFCPDYTVERTREQSEKNE